MRSVDMLRCRMVFTPAGYEQRVELPIDDRLSLKRGERAQMAVVAMPASVSRSECGVLSCKLRDLARGFDSLAEQQERQDLRG